MSKLKVLLNEWDNPTISECVYVGKGDEVYASKSAEEWGFTPNKKYKIKDISMFGYLIMENDRGEIEEYSTEYFQDYMSY